MLWLACQKKNTMRLAKDSCPLCFLSIYVHDDPRSEKLALATRSMFRKMYGSKRTHADFSSNEVLTLSTKPIAVLLAFVFNPPLASFEGILGLPLPPHNLTVMLELIRI